MSQDFSPRMHWFSYKNVPEIYTSNIKYTLVDGGSWLAYTKEDLADRKEHIVLHVLGADVYGRIRDLLTYAAFEKLNEMLKKLTDADGAGDDVSSFPAPVLDWYFNRHNHYYHEENDAEFFDYVRKTYRNKKKAGDA